MTHTHICTSISSCAVFALANVTCEYEDEDQKPSIADDGTIVTGEALSNADHDHDATQQLLEVLNEASQSTLLHGGGGGGHHSAGGHGGGHLVGNLHAEADVSAVGGGRRIRRSETLLRQAADCVSRGQTFQTVSDMFQIPISTIR